MLYITNPKRSGFVIINKDIISASERKAFLFRFGGSRGCKLKISLNENEIMLGWSKIGDLINKKLTQDEIREIIQQAYFKKEKTQIKSGRAASQIWCFLKEMEIGSYVVVPKGDKFYIGRITSLPYFDSNKITVDAAFRREIDWLNYKIPIPRSRASKALQEKMKIGRKCIEITELFEDIIYTMRTI